MKHYLTKYTENGVLKATSWLQISLFGREYCFSVKEIVIK